MNVVYERCVGLDVHKRTVVVCASILDSFALLDGLCNAKAAMRFFRKLLKGLQLSRT
ncbi:hypothetical protein KSD_16370 [Ktedonobacter sp. SOSP1-85]|nr:hypothetical protein KSD_16370 [Ktedonobacter sp. SOSP1-85]